MKEKMQNEIQEITKTGANKGKKKQILFEDKIHGDTVDVDSTEEWYAFGFFSDLHEMGLVRDFVYQPPSFQLTPKFNYSPAVPAGCKQPKDKFLFHPHVYTADFKVEAYVDSPKLLLYFSKVFKIPASSVKADPDTGRLIADIWVDVKGGWIHRAAEFSINQKLVYERFGIYVNKFVPKEAFRKMGCPKCAAKTPTGRASRVFAGMQYIDRVFGAIPEI